MAFHMGTLEGLADCGLLDKVSEVSAVSGGSVLAAAWAASIQAGNQPLAVFLANVAGELAKGFERRTFLHPRLFKAALPGISRTDLLADTFDRLFCGGLTLGALPASPSFFFNAAVMNHNQIGRFTQAGFTSTYLGPPGATSWQGTTAPMPGYALARAATASAAFPGLMSPLILPRGPGSVPQGWVADAGIGPDDPLHMADGGVLDNLGIEAFLSGWGGATARDVVVSDAGPHQEPWRPRGFLAGLGERALTLVVSAFNLGLGAVSALDLYRVAMMMQAKGTRQLRHHLMDTLATEVLAEACLNPPPGAPATESASDIASGAPATFRRRRLLFVRLDQDWDRLLEKIPRWSLLDLASRRGVGLGNVPPAGSKAPVVTAFLQSAGVNLAPAQALYNQMLALRTPAALGTIPTRFKAIGKADLDALALHARWQVLVLKEIFW